MKYITIFSLMTLLLAACDKKGESVANRAGEKLGQQLTDFAKGVGKGVDQKMTVEVSLQPEVAALGLTYTIAKFAGLDANKKSISIYFIASQSVSNTLFARALNGDNVEVGRSKKVVVMQKDDAAYVTFEFDREMDAATVKKYSIGL